MDDRELIRRTLGFLARRLRLVRAVVSGVRFLTVGLIAALVPLAAKGLFPVGGPIAAAALVGGLAIIGFLYGLLASLPPQRAARLADARLQFKERLTSAHELMTDAPSQAPDSGDIVRAQLTETASRLREIRSERAFPLRLPPEARWIPLVAVLCLALMLLPPIPLRLTAASGGGAANGILQAGEEATRGKPLEQKLAPPTVSDQRFTKSDERETQQGPLSAREQQGDLNAVFHDTKIDQKRQDFSGFIKEGDERLKLLARPDSIPDLKRDFTRSPYQVMIRRMQEQVRKGRLQGLTWEQIERLLAEKGKSGPRSGDDDDDDELMNDLRQEGGGSTDKMMDALSRAFNRLRDSKETNDRRLREARDSLLGSGNNRGEGEQGKDRDGSVSGSSMRGTGGSLQTTGDASPRIAGEKLDSFLEGDLREGLTEGVESNLSGPGTESSKHLTYMDVFSQYQKMMEEALTKEPIPFNYRQQVKEYFQSLESW